MGVFLTFWLFGLLGIAGIAVAIWYGVKKARSAPAPVVSEPPSPQAQALKKMAYIAYGLYAAAALFPVTAIAGLTLVYLKQGEAKGTWLASHFRWLIRTFWFMLLWVALGFATFFIFLIGWLILVAAGIWFIYRVVFGWVSLHDGRPMPMEGETAPVPTLGQQG